MTSSTSNINSRVASQEIEMTSARIEGAPETSSGISTETSSKPQFEWNLERLYSHQEGHSQVRTWTVRVLSTVLVLPVALTALGDIARRIAFSLGLVNGKSFSLIDKVSAACQSVASRVQALYKSYFETKQPTLEELNANSSKTIEKHAKQLIDGYRALNGGYFTSNSSFSTPGAIAGERQIEKARFDLNTAIAQYVANNTKGTSDFATHLAAAHQIAAAKIEKLAEEYPDIDSKVERKGPRSLLKTVAWKELSDFQREGMQQLFLAFAKQEPDFAAGLKTGLQAGILTATEAKSALQAQAQAVFAQGLQTGATKAVEDLSAILDSGVNHQIISASELDPKAKNERKRMDQAVQADVETLALAAAKDVINKNPNETREHALGQKLVKAANDLKKAGKLKPEEETTFLTKAKARLAAVRSEAQASKAKEQQVLETLKAQKGADLEKAASERSQHGMFLRILDLIESKQRQLDNRFSRLDILEASRRTVTAELEVLSRETVKIDGRSTTVLSAAPLYYARLLKVSNSQTTPEVRKKEFDALAAEGFTQVTINKINEMSRLEQKLKTVLEQQDQLAQEIHAGHSGLEDLYAKYKVYRGHHFETLEKSNRKGVAEIEKRIYKARDGLKDRHNDLARTSIIDRLKAPSVVVNQDAEMNAAEIAQLLRSGETGTSPQKEGAEGIIVPQARSVLQMGVDIAKAPFNAIARKIWS